MKDEKYVVFKRDEFDVSWLRNTPVQPLEDAVVIRRQDKFAPPALDAYANAIQCVIECLKDTPAWEGEIGNLQGIADYFHEQARLAWDEKRKMPD